MGKPGVLQSMGSQSDTTELLNWTQWHISRKKLTLHCRASILCWEAGEWGINTGTKRRMNQKILVNIRASSGSSMWALLRRSINNLFVFSTIIFSLYPLHSQTNLNIKFGIFSTLLLALWIKEMEKSGNWPRV